MNSPYKGKFKISQIFKGLLHKGMDLIGLTSKSIYSTVDGIIESARMDTNPNNPNDTKYGMGNYIRIKDDITGYRFYFAHLSKVLVKQGQRVAKGDLIGVEGSTGHSTGPHLHYEVRKVPDNTTFLDISKISGIPNNLGVYEQEGTVAEITVDEAKKIVKEKAGLDEKTIDYLANDYKYGAALIIKLAMAMN